MAGLLGPGSGATLESDRPAGAAKRAPESSEVADRHTVGPRRRMIMAMDAAATRTTAGWSPHMHGRRARGDPRTRPRGVTAELPNRRPIGHRWGRRALVEPREVATAVYNPAANNGQVRRDVGNLFVRTGEVVSIRNDKVGELADFDSAFLAFLVGEPGGLLGPHPESRLSVETIALRIDLQAADGPPGDEPGQRHPWVVGRHPRGIRSGRKRDAGLEHPGDRGRRLGHPLSISFDEVLSLIGHPVLHRDPPAERCDAFNGARRDGFSMVKEPLHACEGNVPIDAFEDIERTTDGLVVCRVQPPWPAVLGENAHHRFELAFHLRGHIGPGLPEILKVRSREHEHLPATVLPEVVVSLLVSLFFF